MSLGVHRCEEASNLFFSLVRPFSAGIETSPVLAVAAWQHPMAGNEVATLNDETPIHLSYCDIIERRAIVLITAPRARNGIIELVAGNPTIVSKNERA
jgi:hypothetical protein